ncbi:Uncharacterised protein [Mycobacteroides abscessus subsp. abscessus]|nr:Uncharacterised protein [Mycobacteroides abscessus subsp. abscessus]
MNTRICVCGGGKPDFTKSSRVLVSCGDSEPPSTSANTLLSRARPRTPLCFFMTSSTCSVTKPVAAMRASIRSTAPACGSHLPTSKAVRAGLVTAIPSMRSISLSINVSRWIRKPLAVLW